MVRLFMFNLKRSLKRNYILFLILIIAFIVRIIGLVPGFNPYHPDEGMSYSSAVSMVINGDFNPGRFDYPSGVPLVHYFIYVQFILPFVLFKLFFLNPKLIFLAFVNISSFFSDFRVEIFGNRDIYALFWSRHITAVLGTISVFITYLIGSKLFDKKAGLFAAFFLAFNYRHVYSSHFALSDIPNSLFALLAFLSCLFLFKKNSLKNYLLAGLFIGGSLAIKYQIFPIFTFLGVHFYWFFKMKKISYLFSKKIFLTFFVAVFVFSITNIHFFLNLDEAFYWLEIVSLRYGSGFNHFNFYPVYYLFYWGIGALPSIFIVLGVLLGLIYYPLKTILMLTYIIPFFYVFLYYMSGGTYVRNFTTVIPFLMVFAGLFFSIIFNLLLRVVKKKVLALMLTLILLIIVNLEPIRNSFIVSFSYLRPWNRDVLKVWAEKNLPKTAKIANDNLGLEYDTGSLVEPWNVNEENSIAELQEKNFDFAVANLDWRQSLLYWWFNTDPLTLIKYKDLPYALLDNSYNGIAMQEFLQYAVFEVYKPWQAPELNYFVSKIPPKLENLGKEIYSFNFDKSDENWHAIDIYNNTNIVGLDWDKYLGNTVGGSLVYKGGLKTQGITRYSSKLMPIKPGKVYTIVGFIKTEDVLLKYRGRDGFLRLDFYEDNNPKKVGIGGTYKSVSARVYDTKDWVKRQFTMRAPQNANFLTVSLQKDSYGGRVWVDDVKVYESEKIPENFQKVPLIKSRITKDLLYPNSIL